MSTLDVVLAGVYFIVAAMFYVMGALTSDERVRSPALGALAALFWPVSLAAVLLYLAIEKRPASK